ncbi:MAG: hypothetical protein ACXVA6_21510, partial [Isosphaeraceae bacterium]
ISVVSPHKVLYFPRLAGWKRQFGVVETKAGPSGTMAMTKPADHRGHGWLYHPRTRIPARASGSPASPLSTGGPAPRFILRLLGAVLARGWQMVTSRAAADGIAEGREAQPRGEHAMAGDQPNFGAEKSLDRLFV